RWCNAILAMAVAFKYPDKVSVASVIIGLMTIYPVIMIDSIIQLKRSSMEER
ncbi:ATP synthase subunit, partial [Pediococcus pentosaceus]|nr:ATP synthase subunit [Pediococcus pentosaceus]